MQHYDVYSGDRVFANDFFVMTAPLDVITRVFKLHTDAVKRVIATGDEGCVLHRNSTAWPIDANAVTVAPARR
jgi:hypothetical protein